MPSAQERTRRVAATYAENLDLELRYVTRLVHSMGITADVTELQDLLSFIHSAEVDALYDELQRSIFNGYSTDASNPWLGLKPLDVFNRFTGADKTDCARWIAPDLPVDLSDWDRLDHLIRFCLRCVDLVEDSGVNGQEQRWPGIHRALEDAARLAQHRSDLDLGSICLEEGAQLMLGHIVLAVLAGDMSFPQSATPVSLPSTPQRRVSETAFMPLSSNLLVAVMEGGESGIHEEIEDPIRAVLTSLRLNQPFSEENSFDLDLIPDLLPRESMSTGICLIPPHVRERLLASTLMINSDPNPEMVARPSTFGRPPFPSLDGESRMDAQFRLLLAAEERADAAGIRSGRFAYHETLDSIISHCRVCMPAVIRDRIDSGICTPWGLWIMVNGLCYNATPLIDNPRLDPILMGHWADDAAFAWTCMVGPHLAELMPTRVFMRLHGMTYDLTSYMVPDCDRQGVIFFAFNHGRLFRAPFDMPPSNLVVMSARQLLWRFWLAGIEPADLPHPAAIAEDAEFSTF